MKRSFTYSHWEAASGKSKSEKYLRIWKVLSLVPTGKSKIIGCFWKIICFTKDPFTHLDKGGRNAHPFLRFSKTNFFFTENIPSLIWNCKAKWHPISQKKWENIFRLQVLCFASLKKSLHLFPLGRGQFQPCFKKYFAVCKNLLTYSHWEKPNAHPKSQKIYPFTYLELRSRNAPCFYKNFEKYFLIEGLDSACSKSPFTYSHWEQPNAPPKSQKNFIPSFIWNWDTKTQPVFQEKQKKFFEKTVCLKNIPSLVPTGRGHLGIVIPKKAKKFALRIWRAFTCL